MTLNAVKPAPATELALLISELKARAAALRAEDALRILGRSAVPIEELSAYVPAARSGSWQRRVARTESFELAILTLQPGQSTGAHDHSGSPAVVKLIEGGAHQTLFVAAPDTLVDPSGVRELAAGAVELIPGNVIHALVNARGQTALVGLVVYLAPSARLRHFVIRPPGRSLARAFQRQPAGAAPVVAIIGGGFCGAMVAANLARRTAPLAQAVHVVIVDPQPSIALGTAYRTKDIEHLLNVPISRMSAWHDQPDDLLGWARVRDPSVGPYAFLPRLTYGQYLRDTFLDAIERANPVTSVEIRRDEAKSVERRGERGWRVFCRGGLPIDADAVVIATGHRAPDDPLRALWVGRRTRYIDNPWATGALSEIQPNDAVCLLGTGLTAIDVYLSLAQTQRRAPVLALSRHGLSPVVQAKEQLSALDPKPWLEVLLGRSGGPTTRELLRGLREAISRAEAAGDQWRQVVDGLRPHLSGIWRALPVTERARFLRHGRVYWDVARHRCAPAVDEQLKAGTDAGLYRTMAGRVIGASGIDDKVSLRVLARGANEPETHDFDWLVNCTGPGTERTIGEASLIAALIKAGHLEGDALGLGVRTSAEGRAHVQGRIIDGLVIVGTLRRADLWESTAVPELRVQAALAAEVVVQRCRESARSKTHARQ